MRKTLVSKIILAVMALVFTLNVYSQPGFGGGTGDAVLDFSIQSNPVGVWSYGYKPLMGQTFTTYTRGYHNSYFDIIPGLSIDIWDRPTVLQPSIMRNNSNSILNVQTIVLPPDLLLLHPGDSGEQSVLRWTAPASGTFQFQGHFQGLDNGSGTTTNVDIIHNSAANLFTDNVTGYGTQRPFTVQAQVDLGDTVDFSVGYGSNNTYYSDSTGLAVAATAISIIHPTPTPTPAILPTQSRAYVTNLSSNNVSVIDVATNTATTTIPVGNNPLGVAIKPDGTLAYVTNLNDNNVSVIDTATSTVLGSIPVGSGPITVAFTPDGTRAYVANHFSHNVSVINTATNTVIATVPVQANPQGIAITPDGSRVYVANLVSSTVSVIDIATNAVIANIAAQTGPIGVTISSNGAEVYVTNISSASVSVINAATNTIIATINVGGEPYVTAFSPNGSRAYVTNRSTGSVSVIDSATRVVTGTIPVGAVPVGIALTSNGNRAYVANFNSANVSVVDTSSNTVIATIPTGINPHYVAIWEVPNTDSTPPVITPTITGIQGSDGWYTTDVDVTWSVDDPDSAVSWSTGCDAVSVTADTSGVTYICSATSSGGTSTQSVNIKRDATAPTISITSPETGNYLLNQAATVSFACSDATAGIAACDGTTAVGSSLETSSVGAKSFTVNATDNSGNTSSTTVNYTVGYGVAALYDQTRAHKSGSTVPIKIQLVDANGANVSSASLIVHAASVIQTSSQASTVLDDAGESNPDFDFRYDAELNGYIYNLKTTGFGTGSYSLNFSVGLSSTLYSVAFQVRQ